MLAESMEVEFRENEPISIRLDYLATLLIAEDRTKRLTAYRESEKYREWHRTKYTNGDWGAPGGLRDPYVERIQGGVLSPNQWYRRVQREVCFPAMDTTEEYLQEHHRVTSGERWWVQGMDALKPADRYRPRPKAYDTMTVRTRKMSDKHEQFLVDLLGGVLVPGSGSSWARKMDVRQSRFAKFFAFAFDGKSTLGKSIGVTREMWRKAKEQAGGERPALALRFYDNERLTGVEMDLIVVDAQDFAEVVETTEQALVEVEHARAEIERLKALLREED